MNKPNTKKPASIITLKTYVEVLRRASLGGLPPAKELPDDEARIVRELFDAGLLSDASTKSGFATFFSYTVITPDGAIALESWSSFLKESSMWYKAGESFIRFLWLLAGALCASITDIFQYIWA